MDELFATPEMSKNLYSIEAEQAVLGSAILDNKCIGRVSGSLASDDFYLDTNREIFEVIRQMHLANKPVDAVTVRGEMMQQCIFDPQTIQAYLVELVTVTPTTVNVGEYIEIVREKSVLRKIWENAERTRQAILDGKTSDELLTQIDRDTEALTHSAMLKTEEQPNSAYMETLLDAVKSNKAGKTWATPWESLNTAIGGGIKAKLYVLGAGTGAGKTSFVMQIADYYASFHGMPVLVASMEMSRNELIARSMARIAHQNDSNSRLGVDDILSFYNEERTASEKSRFSEAYTQYRDSIAPRMTVLECEGKFGTAELWGAVQRCYNQFGKAPLLIVDYLQLLHNPDTRIPEVQRLGNAVMELKRISRRFGCPVFCISSTNRASNTSTATVADFLGSSMIEYSADFAFLLKNEDESMNSVKAGEENERPMKLVIAKGRSQKTNGGISFTFCGKFSEYEER